jgi:hypothetical protein
MTDIGRAHYSRFQVLCAERPAWARPALRRETHYYFDGLRFWARSADGDDRLLPSWRAPRYGWIHESGCDCRFCDSRVETATAQLLAS